MGERRLFACVVKAQPINGRADDHKNGAPTLVDDLQTVVNQISSAFSESLADGSGKDEWVDSVYVISPYDCATSTIDSVKARLQRSGQIRFVCGSDLMDLFVQHWKDFLWFGSSILVSYLSTLRKGLEENYAERQEQIVRLPGPTGHAERGARGLNQQYRLHEPPSR